MKYAFLILGLGMLMAAPECLAASDDITLYATICKDGKCHEETVAASEYDRFLTSRNCSFQAQLLLAAWMGFRPKWEIQSYRCGPSSEKRT